MSGRRLPEARVRMLVCGNADRGDDGVAPVAVATLLATLPTRLRARLDVRRSTELRVEDLADLPPDTGCLIVDAVAGVEPGEVVRVPLSQLGDRPGFAPRSSHQLPIHLVVGLAGILRERPVDWNVHRPRRGRVRLRHAAVAGRTRRHPGTPRRDRGRAP